MSATAIQIQFGPSRTGWIDAEDADILSAGSWRAVRVKGTKWYVRSYTLKTYLHTLLTGFTFVDHINGDGLDNRRANLRRATPAQNMFNMKSRGGSSPFKGVHWDRQRSRWRAQIRLARKQYYLGSFINEIEAARAYDAAARELFGEFAALNFPDLFETSALR